MITLDELLAMPGDRLVERLCRLTAEERAALRPVVRRRFYRPTSSELTASAVADGGAPRRGCLYDVLVAVDDARELRLPTGAAHWRIARSRGPRHVQALAESTVRRLAHLEAREPEFGRVRDLERAGAVRLDADDDYVLAMISGLTGWAGEGRGKAERLRGDPELVERAFWRLFEIEGNRSVSLASAQPESWSAAVVELAAEGTVDRQRVLNATLDALGRDFAPYRAGWFSRLHAALRPAVDELAARQAAYANLLRSPVGPTRTLAVDALVALDKAGRLDDATVAGGLAAAVHATAKSTAVKAVRLLARVAERRGPDGIADAVAAGLGHPHADVQATALTELRRLDAGRLARPYLTGLAPAVAREAAAWLGAPPVRVALLAPVRPPAPAPATPVSPIRDPDELGEALAVLLENPGDGELAERCLAALARLGPDPERYGSLARRAGRLARDDRGLSDGLYAVLADLVFAAAGEPEPRRTRPSPIDPVVHLLAERAADVARALRSGSRNSALAAEPTHTGGWIDPSVLVDRLLAAPPPGPADAVAALLRLGPQPDDPAALAAAAPVPGGLGEALRYALGGPPARIPRRPAPDDLALWVAAARARDPYGDDAPLIAAGHDEAGLGRAPWWRVAAPLVRTRDPYPARPTLELHGRDGARYATAHPLLPTAAQAVEGHGPSAQYHGGNYLAWYPWAALIWPGNPSAPLATGLRRLHEAILGIREPVAAQALDLVATTAARLPPLAPYVLAFGFGSSFAADRTRAVDAALAVLPHRLAPADLGGAMAVLAPFVPVNRWTGALGDLAAAGRETEVVAVLAAFLPAVDRTVRGLHGPVELLRDLRLTGRASVGDGPLREWLATTAGNSKLAKAAQAALEPLDLRR